MAENCGPEHLHAPWRMEYIENADKPKGGCIFCDKPCEDCDAKNYIVYRGERCFIILNAFPYNNGHLMVIPYQHTSTLADLPPETQLEMLQLATTATTALTRVMKPDGFNLGINIGRAGGAGIAEHLHLHVVPRWVGDTNFITTIGNTRVLPESLERTWEKLRRAFTEVLTEK
ncbi:MAG TPA: HIT domain-containing protein [Armatimonadota bacterium]|nr:HIT domain-containing protein [Armatimonadota bacterium]